MPRINIESPSIMDLGGDGNIYLEGYKTESGSLNTLIECQEAGWMDIRAISKASDNYHIEICLNNGKIKMAVIPSMELLKAVEKVVDRYMKKEKNVASSKD